MRVDTLSPEQLVKTIRKLHLRIGERFPDSGLQSVCEQLSVIGENMKSKSAWIGQPVRWLRALVWTICVLIVVIAILPFCVLGFQGEAGPTSGTFSYQIGEGDEASSYAGKAELSGFEFESDSGIVDVITLMEAGINDVVLIGAAIFFLLSFETRYKRQRALKAIHELRSIAHVIDMHQLTKDPHRIMKRANYVHMGQSPKLKMTEFQLRRYLDYCSEMLSLVGKIAAVYVQEFDDGVAMASASELEALTTGLSGKIWQKIAILHSAGQDDSPTQSTKPGGGPAGNPVVQQPAKPKPNPDAGPNAPLA